ncbi:MAG: hypothetical protein AAF502_18715 [Bacteroidota bacterium]
MRSQLSFSLIALLCICFTSCNTNNQSVHEPDKNKTEVVDTKTHVIKLLYDEAESIDLKVDPSSKLGKLDKGNYIHLIGNLLAPSKLELKSSTNMMTTISMQAAEAPAPVQFDESKAGYAAVIQSSLFQGDIYEASIICICDRALDEGTMEALTTGELHLDDICK